MTREELEVIWNKYEAANTKYVKGYKELYNYIREHGYERSSLTVHDHYHYIDVFTHQDDKTHRIRLKDEIVAEYGHHAVSIMCEQLKGRF